MKNHKLLITLLALALISFKATAGGDEKNKETNNHVSFEIKDQIVRALNYPLSNLNIMGEKEIILSFHINNNHELVVDSLQTTNGFLATEVIKMLRSHKVYTKAERHNQPYRLRLRFIN